jgi:Flp pilus assembly protein TadD
LGIALSFRKKYPEAIAELEQAVRLEPQNAQMRFELGQVYLLNRDKQSARVQYEKLVALDPLKAKQLYGAIYAKLLINAAEK